MTGILENARSVLAGMPENSGRRTYSILNGSNEKLNDAGKRWPATDLLAFTQSHHQERISGGGLKNEISREHIVPLRGHSDAGFWLNLSAARIAEKRQIGFINTTRITQSLNKLNGFARPAIWQNTENINFMPARCLISTEHWKQPLITAITA